MYSVKGSLVGQTFALAAANDSRGKKSRIRLSKEKRKTLIESFIRRYQSSNKGRFPSLNLTHKEVGGSFYTVREIVREIIQENRVLGPGQFSTEEQDNDFITVNYPLGSIASEPQGLLFEKASELYDLSGKEGKESVVLGTESNGKFTKQFDLELVQYSIENSTEEKGQGTDRSSPSENLIISEHSEEASFEASLNGNRKCLNVNELDNVNFGNHVQTNDASEGPSKLLVKAEEESERMGVIQGKDKLTLPTEKVQVETFPLRSAIELDDEYGSSSNNSGNFDGKLNDLEVKKVNISNSTLVLDKASSVGSSSGLVITKGADSSEVPASGNSEGTPDVMIQHAEFNSMVNQHGEVKLTNDSEDNSYSLPINDDTASAYTGVNQLSSHGDSCLETIEQSSLEPKNASKGATCSESSNVTSYNNVKEPTVASGTDFKRDDKARVGSSPPLDRIDLGSWKASKQETNPLLAFFKAFVDAFVKFCSE